FVFREAFENQQPEMRKPLQPRRLLLVMRIDPLLGYEVVGFEINLLEPETEVVGHNRTFRVDGAVFKPAECLTGRTYSDNEVNPAKRTAARSTEARRWRSCGRFSSGAGKLGSYPRRPLRFSKNREPLRSALSSEILEPIVTSRKIAPPLHTRKEV